MSRDDPAGPGRCRTTCKGVRGLVEEQRLSGILQGDQELGRQRGRGGFEAGGTECAKAGKQNSGGGFVWLEYPPPGEM